MNAVSVSPDRSCVTVQGGAIWSEVYAVTREAGIDVVGAPFWFVGVGGYLTGGGNSPFSSVHGVGLDNTLSATVVLADGRIVKTSKSEEPDLFWAIRGGGNQFGIVVEFVINAFPTWGPFMVGALAISGKETDEALSVIQGWKRTHSAHERIGIAFARPGPHFKPAVTILPWIARTSPSSETDVVQRSHTDCLAPFRALGPVMDKVVEVPDMLAVSHASDPSFAALPKALTIRGTLVADLWEDVMREVWDLWLDFTAKNEGAQSSAVVWDLTQPDGIGKVRPGETAFHARGTHYLVAVQGRSANEESLSAMRKFTSDMTAYIRDRNAQKMRENNLTSGATDVGYFLNFAQGDEPPEVVHGPNLPKLRKLKAKYDPKGFWNRGIFIEPGFNSNSEVSQI